MMSDFDADSPAPLAQAARLIIDRLQRLDRTIEHRKRLREDAAALLAAMHDEIKALEAEEMRLRRLARDASVFTHPRIYLQP